MCSGLVANAGPEDILPSSRGEDCCSAPACASTPQRCERWRARRWRQDDYQVIVMDIGIAPQHPGVVLVHEYGVRLDKECLETAWDQISRARSLYNELVASIRSIFGGMQTFVLENGGAEAQALQARIETLNAAFRIEEVTLLH